MLINCYLKCHRSTEKSLKSSLFISLFLFLFAPSAWAVTQNYRLVLTENPANSIIIGWELLAGCPDTQRVYYDTVDHGQDTAAYRFQKPITASYFHQGMENYFCTLADLKADTRYYFVIGEDEGISKRYWFRTLSATDHPWQAFWVSPKVPDWSLTNTEIREGNADFVLGEDFSQFVTEPEWRQWLQNWQKSISSSGQITPLLIAGFISPDLRYLFNPPSTSVATYFFSSRCVLISSGDEEKLKSRVLKQIPDEAFIIQHTAVFPEKLLAAVALQITASPAGDQVPNRFSFPDNTTLVELHWADDRLSIQASGEKLLDIYAN